ncbi:hypothetical protein DB32_000556 [Sandaracinus amylolyticus]|uniref:Uncharacterized protein n=1 Tax=Sandaracinus amylolyticus TaxID=927083 RepID=A0A0F6YFB4_9BACT|nr:hypothetical protein DB32_000556 [Sandaracinus amylolyticus]
MMLVLGCTDNDVAFALKTQEQIRGAAVGDIHFSYAAPFVDERSWTLGMCETLRVHFELANEERAKKSIEALEQFPERMSAESTSPRERVLIAIEHFTQWLADPAEFRVVFSLLPTAIHNADAYYRFVGSFAQLGEREPWMEHARVIVRDDRRARPLTQALTNLRAQGVLSYDLDFSTDALCAGMAAEAVDPAVPLAERMQATLQLAMIDMSYRRFDEAIAKFIQLYEYYGAADTPLMQALCLNGVGDCFRMAGLPDRALERYQQGLALAMKAKPPAFMRQAQPTTGADDKGPSPMHPNAPPIMLNLLLAAGATSAMLGQHGDARSYFDTASRTAARCLNASAAAQALEARGDSELALSLFREAAETWTQAEQIAEAAQDVPRQRSALERLHRLYSDARMRTAADAAARKLAGLQRTARA